MKERKKTTKKKTTRIIRRKYREEGIGEGEENKRRGGANKSGMEAIDIHDHCLLSMW